MSRADLMSVLVLGGAMFGLVVGGATIWTVYPGRQAGGGQVGMEERHWGLSECSWEDLSTL